jgi:hypothetical protein
LLFGPSTGPPRPSKKESAQGAGTTQKEEEEKEQDVEQQLVGQRITAPPATETSMDLCRPVMHRSSEEGPVSPAPTASRLIVVEPTATTEEDAAVMTDGAGATADAAASTDASAPARLETETFLEQTSPVIRASGVTYPDRDPTVPLVWLFPPVKKRHCRSRRILGAVVVPIVVFLLGLITMNSSSEKDPFSPALTARRWIVVEPMATTEEDAAATADAATAAFWPFSKSYHRPWSTRTRPRDPSHWHCVDSVKWALFRSASP